MTTTVTSTILFPDDSPATHGRVRIQLAGVGGVPVVGYLASDGSAVEGVLRLGVDANGVWSTPLVPNIRILPAGTVWRVMERIGPTLVNDEPITVPDDNAVHEFADLITDFPGALDSSALELERERALTAEAALQAAIDAVEASDVDSVNGRIGTVTGLAEQADLAAEVTARGTGDTTLQANITAEAVLARNADNLTSGTVADARVASTIARDSEVTAAVAAEALLARNADNLTSGTVADARIASTIARDSEVTNAVTAEQIRADAAISAAIAGKQPLDSDLTAIAALATTAFGRSVLALADAAALRTLAGLGSAAVANTTDFDAAGAAAAAQAASQPLDSDLTAIAALTTTAYGRAFLALADAAAGRTALGLGTAATQASTAFDAAGAATAAQAYAIQRANHTGTQTLATISDAGTAAAANTGTGAANVPTVAQADARYDASGLAAAEATTARAAELALQDGVDLYLRATCS